MQKLYKDESGDVWGYESDGSQDHLIGDKVSLTQQEVDAHLAPPPIPDCTQITKLQAVRYFQNNGIDDEIDALIASDPKRKARWDATTVLVIDDADVLALASAAEALTGKDVQTMFNEARGL